MRIKAQHWKFVLLGLAFMLPLAFLCLFSHPAADDFPISHTARDWGSYTSVVGYYKCWSARYTSIFLMSVNPLVFGSFFGYKLIPILVMAGLFLSVRFFLTGLWGSGKSILPLAILMTLVFLLSMSDLSGGLYYLGGSLFYQPGNMLLAVLIGSLFRNPPPPSLLGLNLKSWANGIVQGFLLILLVGCNEICMMLAMAISGTGLFFELFLRKKVSAGWVLLLMVSSIAALIVLKSPATFYRMEANGGFGRNWPEIFMNASNGMFMAFFHWFSSPALPVFLLLAAIMPLTPLEKLNLNKFIRWGISAGSFLLFFICFLPSFLGEGLLQGRTENTLLFLFLILFLLNLRIWKSQWKTEIIYEKTKSWLVPAFFISLCLSPAFLLAISDLVSGEAAAFSAERDYRDSVMRNTPGDSIWIEPLRHKPKSLVAGDIGDYPDPWYDNHFAELYGKRFVHLKPEGGAKH